MSPDLLRVGYTINRRAIRAVTPQGDFTLVVFADGTSRKYHKLCRIDGVARQLPQSGVKIGNGWYLSPQPRVRASDPTWRGQFDGTRAEHRTARMRAWDK